VIISGPPCTGKRVVECLDAEPVRKSEPSRSVPHPAPRAAPALDPVQAEQIRKRKDEQWDLLVRKMKAETEHFWDENQDRPDALLQFLKAPPLASGNRFGESVQETAEDLAAAVVKHGFPYMERLVEPDNLLQEMRSRLPHTHARHVPAFLVLLGRIDEARVVVRDQLAWMESTKHPDIEDYREYAGRLLSASSPYSS
jgi:hypothetical protein